jgi:tetratricopeptide (TPR) repeat protein
VDELDDLLSDVDDDDEQGELPVSHPRQSAQPSIPKPPPQRQEETDALFDALLDEPIAGEAPAVSAAKGLSGPSSAAVTVRAAKPAPPAIPSVIHDEDDEDEPTRAIASVRGIEEAIAAATAEEEPSAEDLEAIAAAEELEDEPVASLSGGPESMPGDAGDADAAPPSVLTPPSLRPVPPKTFPHEQDASVRLLQAHQRDAWAARATWLHAEAQALEDKTARARALVTVSELYVMAGEEATARTIAAEARDLAPSLPLAQRQLRGLLDREGDSKAVLEVLDAEARVMPTPASRAHSILLAAEVARLRLGEAEGAKKRFEQAARILPSDPRAHLQRFCEALAAPDPDPQAPAELPRIPLPDARDLVPLGKAFAQVAAHRGLPVKSNRLPGSLYESLLRARAALGRADVAGALTNIETLRNAPELAGGAGWIASAFAASRPETRKRAVEALQSVLGGSHGDVARRALAGYSVELGDAQAARTALEGATSSAFEPGDRVALAALTGGSREEAEPWLNALLGDSELSPITAAASAALGDPADENRKVYPVGSLRSKAAVTLGRLLASVMDRKDRSLSSDRSFDDAVLAYADVAPDNGIARALKLELDVDAGRGSKVAQVISSWPTDDLDRDRDQALAGALIAEAAGELERAVADLDRARLTDAKHEGAVRARAAHGDPKTASKIITELADSLGAGPRSAVLLAEAAVRLLDAGEIDDAEPLLRRAVEAAPKLPVALHLGERSARAKGDRDGLIDWLRTRRGSSEDAIEQALDLVREALLVSDTDAASAASLLEQALRARPVDVGLRELYERLAPEPPADRAAWRSELASKSTGLEAARFALEAALEYERAGDLERAAAEARRAMAAGETLLAPICAYRCAIAGHGAGDMIDALLPRARETADAVERLEIYERLADLDELGRNDPASGLLWRKSILEESPSHLPTLRRVASALMANGRDEDLEPIALEIARALDNHEAVAHALVSARLRLRLGTWEDTREPVEIAYRHEPRGLFTLRQMAAHARAQGKHGLAIEIDRQLIERTQRPSEVATLSLRAAESAVVGGDIDSARAHLTRAIEAVPQHFVAHLALAGVAEQVGDGTGAATALESAAEAAVSPDEKARALYRAATLWQDRVQDVKRARLALERVSEVDPAYEDVFQRLQTIYIAEGARGELAGLLERRLEAVTDPAERIEMEVLRGRALADVGDSAAAKRALAAALEASPDHTEALSIFANVSAAEQDWLDAERAWIHLARLTPDQERQVEIYMRLGNLYDEHLPNPERAELAYQEILKREANSEIARERLVTLYKRTGDTAKAIEQQTILINNAEAPEAKCRRTTELASIYEATGDNKKAEATLVQARKTWPKDDVALGALARFYQRTNQATALNVLLDRALADARRALSTGRFEVQLFGTVAAVAELRGRHDAARIAHAVVASLEGNDAALEGAGEAAADPRLDELLAPEVISPAFRDLLRRTGSLLDVAVPYDMTAVRGAPLPPQQAELGDHIRRIAAAYGLGDVSIHVSTVLGAVCIPASAHPPTLVLGQPLLASPREDVRDFLIHRALKIIQTNSSAFSRTAPIDLWPLLAAYLKLFSPSWSPQGIEASRLNDAYGRLSRALTTPADADLGALAADVIGNIGNRASTLNTAINSWGNRAALLAIGDPNIALSGIAWASGNINAPPASGKDRVTWIGRNAEARDIAVYLVSDGYADARTQLGLVTAAPPAADDEAQTLIDESIENA